MITKKFANSVRTSLFRNLRYLIVRESDSYYVGFAKSLSEAQNMVKIACETKSNIHNKTGWREDYYLKPIEQASYNKLRRFILDMLIDYRSNTFSREEMIIITGNILEYYSKRYNI